MAIAARDLEKRDKLIFQLQIKLEKITRRIDDDRLKQLMKEFDAAVIDLIDTAETQLN